MAQQDLMQRWLKTRQTMIVELVGLTRELRSDHPADELLKLRFQCFCEHVVDYVSAGHFEIYPCLVAYPAAAACFAKTRTSLQQTTDKVLAFNAAVTRKTPDLSRQRRLLADVGIALEQRLAIEDRLIASARIMADTSVAHLAPTLTATA